MADVQEVTLSVPDVSCEHCVKAINGALGALPGMKAVSTDIPTKTVHLRYDPGQLSMEIQEKQRKTWSTLDLTSAENAGSSKQGDTCMMTEAQ